MNARQTDALPHVFGPVPSRRLGRSLGVDLVPFKTCSYDCIYCQLGRTTCRTVERKEWVPMDAVLEELKHKLASHPDYITLSGSGEPTLHSRLGEIIEHIQVMSKVPVAVLTNGSLLWQSKVREEVALADVVIPSLDAGDELLFSAVNRPDPSLTFEKVVSGLEQFRREFSGQYWLEVLLLAGHTALPAHVRKIVKLVRQIRPDRVQLNTASRPPAEDFAIAVPQARLKELAMLFRPKAEVIAEYRPRDKGAKADADEQSVVNLLKRRPCSETDVARGLAMRPIEVSKHLAHLTSLGRVVGRRHGDQVYYYAAPSAPTDSDACNLLPPRGSESLDPREPPACQPSPRRLNEGMSDMIIQLNSKSFPAAVKKGAVLVDFWEPWCGPCQTQLPILEDVARQVAGRARVAKVNVDEAQKLAARVGIQSIPTVVLFKNGKVVDQFLGSHSSAALIAAIERVLDETKS